MTLYEGILSIIEGDPAYFSKLLEKYLKRMYNKNNILF